MSFDWRAWQGLRWGPGGKSSSWPSPEGSHSRHSLRTLSGGPASCLRELTRNTGRNTSPVQLRPCKSSEYKDPGLEALLKDPQAERHSWILVEPQVSRCFCHSGAGKDPQSLFQLLENSALSTNVSALWVRRGKVHKPAFPLSTHFLEKSTSARVYCFLSLQMNVALTHP